MQNTSVWQHVLGLADTVVEGVDVDDQGSVVVSVRPYVRARQRCGRCGARGAWYDRGEGRRRWRALDVGEVRVFVQADAPRVACRRHRPTVVQVPWARHGAGHTRAFDDTVAWLALQLSKTAVTEFMRVGWRTVGAILARVGADIDAKVDRLDGLRRVGIDEISYRRGQRYLTIVIDHDTGRLVWAAPGRDARTLDTFFDQLGGDRAALITHVSADGADWISRVVKRRCPQAVLCLDPFHVVAWALDALDEVRRKAWNDARGPTTRRSSPSAPRVARADRAHPLKQARFALRKNPERLTPRQRHQLDWIANTHPDVWRAYQLKELMRLVFQLGGDDGKATLDTWIEWARRSRLLPFVELQRRVVRHRASIDAALDHGLTQARVEAVNTRIRLLTRIAYGFHGPQPLIALVLLALGGHRPALPRRG